MTRPRWFRLGAVTLGCVVALAVVGGAEWWCRAEEAHDGVVIPIDEPGRKYALQGSKPGEMGWGGHAGGYRLNSEGFHEREIPHPRPKGMWRIAVLGDSVTFGGGLRREQVYPRVAESILRAEGLPVQLLNFSVYGYDIEQEWATLHYRVWAYDPQVVVYAYFTNDAIPSELLRVGKSKAPIYIGDTLTSDETWLPLGLARWLVPRSALYRRLLGARIARLREQDPKSHLTGPLGFFDGYLDKMIGECKAHEVPLLVFGIGPHVLADPDLDECGLSVHNDRFCYNQYDQLLRMGAKVTSKGLPWVNAVDWYRASGQKSFYLPGSDDPIHPNAVGHHILGEALADMIVRWMTGDPSLLQAPAPPSTSPLKRARPHHRRRNHPLP